MSQTKTELYMGIVFSRVNSTVIMNNPNLLVELSKQL